MLLALTTLDAVDHNVLQTTPVDARRIGPLEGQLAHCCPVAPGVATQRRSPPAGNPLHHWGSCSAPERIRTSDLRFRRRVRPKFGSIEPNLMHEVAKKSPETLRSSSSVTPRRRPRPNDAGRGEAASAARSGLGARAPR